MSLNFIVKKIYLFYERMFIKKRIHTVRPRLFELPLSVPPLSERRHALSERSIIRTVVRNFSIFYA